MADGAGVVAGDGDEPAGRVTGAERGLTVADNPESVGIDSAAVLDFLGAVEQAGLDPHSLMLVRHGSIAAAGWWAPYSADDITLLYSLSKSFTSTAVGFAVAERRLDLDATLAGYFPGLAAGPRARMIRIRHLLAMCTGHQADTLDRLDPGDPVGSFLAVEPDAEPGTLFTYNNGATLMLSALLTERTGQDVGDYLRPRFFGPLSIGRLFWERVGRYQQGFSGLHLTTESVARLGQTYLTGGSFAGRTVLPDGWAAQASAVHTANAGRAENIDWQQGYGFQFWRSRHGFRGDGAAGQFCLVLPEQDLVVAATGAMQDMQAYLDRVWQVLLPGVTDAPLPPAPGVTGRLTERLASLSLPLPVDRPAGDIPADRLPGEFALGGDPAQTLGISAARVQSSGGAATGGGREGWTLTLSDGRARYRVPVTADHFVRSEHPVGDAVLTLAASGGWTHDGRFVADVVLVNTPHRFRMTADPRTGRADTQWHIAPLHKLSLPDRAIPAPGGVA